MNIEIKRFILVVVIIIALLEASRYVYGINGSSPPTNAQHTPQPTLDQKAIHFAVIGDYGNAGPAAAAVATMVKGWQPDFIISTGDNNYGDGSSETIDVNIGQYYSEYIYPYNGAYPASHSPNRFFPALGNHDWQTDKAQPYLDYFPISTSSANTGSSHNERYYDFIQGPFISLF